MKAPIHPNETARIGRLRDYGILDTPPEAEFDEIVELVARICDSTTAHISLIDQDRQWLKSRIGLGVIEAPVETAICAHAILAGDYLEIRDMTKDPRTADNPFVCGPPGVRFYAGAVLMSSDGLPMGTLCLLDVGPRVLSELQRDTLKVMARQIMLRLDHRRDLRHADLMRQEIDHRTKNSLQSVASMIRLLRRRATQDETRAALDKALLQIDTVAALHRELYEASASDRIDIARFGTRLAVLMRRTVPDGVRIDTDLAEFQIGSRAAASFGVLVNEFIANSVKHAYVGGRTGTIEMIGKRAADSYDLTLRDDGPGYSGDTSENLGLQVLRAAAADLGSTDPQFVTTNGVCLSLTIPAWTQAG